MIAYAVITVPLLALALCAAAGRWSPFYASLLRKPPQRFVALDGLRGLLAIGVFLHHAELTRHQIKTGVWGTDSPFFEFLGRAGVACFFMITALLFWDKVLASDGKLDLASLYRSRSRRIVPMYAFSFACLLVGVAWSSHFTIRVPLRDLVNSIGAWAAFGWCGFPNVNGVDRTRFIAAGVHWTLTYEWGFYLALPFLAVFRKPLPFAGMLVATWFFLVHVDEKWAVNAFLVGMVVATALRLKPPAAMPALRHPALAAVALLFLGASFWAVHDTAFGEASAVLMGCFFYIVASGNTLGGLLTSRPARVLGTVSYSLYLLQGLVLFAGRSLVRLKGADPATIGLFETVCGLALTLVSFATYRWIEHPYLAPRAAPNPAPVVQPAALTQAP
jgi:peptidoglycan/LPS O-acetylase OafA/YrhL